MCRNQIVYESDSFLLLDRINRWAPLVMYRSRTHPIPLLEVIHQTGGTIEFRDFPDPVLSQKSLDDDLAKHLVTTNGLGSNRYSR
jgi:hypothetical protein